MAKRIFWILAAVVLSASLMSGCEGKGKKAHNKTLPAFTEEGVTYNARTQGKAFQVYGEDSEWHDIFLTGVNIGAGKPGFFPGEMGITKDDYARWLAQIGAMNVNTVRVYTILKPEFYEALLEYNSKAEKPLYFIQGIYNNEDDVNRYQNAYAAKGKLLYDWMDMCETIVDVVHGKADIEQQTGHAYGKYTADVSQYLIGWILGIEWYPDFVSGTDDNNPNVKDLDSTYLKTENATPFEIFLAQGMEVCIAYETTKYGRQHPTAFANWVTTDPLEHPGEPSKINAVAINEDAVSVDAEHIIAKDAFKAGFFTSYHVYPYYPDMLNYAPELLMDDPPTPYKRYLTELNEYHTMPVLVSEFGVPASRGITHEGIYSGFNQGHNSEKDQGNAITSMINTIYEVGCCGALAFIWEDEWFKRAWNTMDFNDPENRAYWSDIQTSEQHFGFLSFDPGNESSICYVDGDTSDWGNTSGKLTVKSDEKYVYLLIKSESASIYIDTVPNQGIGENNVGAEFLLTINGTELSSISIDPYYDLNYWRYATDENSGSIEFDPLYTKGSRFVPILQMLNRKFIHADGTVHAAQLFETSRLRYGNGNPNSEDYDSLADFCWGDGVTEVRIPWALLNIAAPNAKLRVGDVWANGDVVFEEIDKINFIIDGEKVEYTWKKWTSPSYHERLKQSYFIVRDFLSDFNQTWVSKYDVSGKPQETSSDGKADKLAAPKQLGYTAEENRKPAEISDTPLDASQRPSGREKPFVEDAEVKSGPTPIKNSPLPRVDIEFDDKDALLSRTEYVKSAVGISNAGEYDVYPQSAGVRIRGNWTAFEKKRPLRIKFDAKVSIFGEPAAKSWVLLANYYDKTLMHNYVAYNLYNYLTPNDVFSPMIKFVDVYVNGMYQGVYTMTDQIETGNARVDIGSKPNETPAETDFLIVQDYTAFWTGFEEGREGVDWFWMNKVNDAFKLVSPNSGKDGYTPEYTAYIKKYMDDAFDVVLSKDWAKIQETIDVDSFIRGFAVHEIVKNNDVKNLSVYYSKKADGKLTFNPIWDCDMTFGAREGGGTSPVGTVAEANFMFGNLMRVPEFKAQYTEFFNEKYNGVLTYMTVIIANAYNQYGASLANDYNYWEKGISQGYLPEVLAISDYKGQVEYLRDFIVTRLEWLYNEYNA